MNDLTVIVLAAGGGTRMKSKTMKVLHPLAGRTMIGHVLNAVAAVEPRRIVAVVGHQRDQVGAHIKDLVPDAVLAVQEDQHGTGHAVRIGWEALAAADRAGTVLVTAGDTPLLRGSSLQDLVAAHRSSGDAITILTGRVETPYGYGRIIRDEHNVVTGIVEEKDATPEQAEIDEINSGILAFDAAFLDEALPLLRNDNAAQEYYLTDTIALAVQAGRSVGAYVVDDVSQTEGVNDRVQLAQRGAALNRMIVEHWMVQGVTVVDPATTWIDADVDLAPDVTILPNVQLLGATTVAEDAVIGPDSTLRDTEVGPGAHVVRTHAELAVVGAGATVGPFAHLRPGTTLGVDSKIGGFVETKNSVVGDRAKVPHLTYVGDAEIGEGANIGAGSVFANYDGANKHRTVVGRHAKTASNTTFVAPVTIGDGAATGAGTVVRDDVPPGALAVSAGPQRNIARWALTRRAGTDQARAAQEALDAVTEERDGGPDVAGAPPRG